MARLRNITDDLQEKIADRLGQFLSGGEKSFGADATVPLVLQENFPIMSLEKGAVGQGSEDVREFLEETGAELHQIARDGRPVGFSISHFSDVENPVIDQYTQTTEAQSIASTIELLDAMNFPDDYEARIVDVRALALGVIILISDDERPSLIAPFRVPLNQDQLQVGRVYESSEFRSALRGFPTSGGFTPEEPPRRVLGPL